MAMACSVIGPIMRLLQPMMKTFVIGIANSRPHNFTSSLSIVCKGFPPIDEYLSFIWMQIWVEVGGYAPLHHLGAFVTTMYSDAIMMIFLW